MPYLAMCVYKKPQPQKKRGCGLENLCEILVDRDRFPTLVLPRSGAFNIKFLLEYSEVGGVRYLLSA